jgi:glutathione S-transferase
MLHSKEFKKFNPASLTPCLVGEHSQIVSAPAIIRYAGLRKPELYGKSLIEKAQVD